MFLYRFYFGPLLAFIIAVILFQYWPIIDIEMKIFMGVFMLITLLISVGTYKYVRGLKVALREHPDSCTIVVKSHSVRKGPPRYVVEIFLEGRIWRASLAGTKYDRACVGDSQEGYIWRHPKTGKPYAAEINNKKLAIIPIVIEIKPDSLTEKVIQQVYKTDLHTQTKTPRLPS